MVYKGYIARIEYSNADSCFIGRIAGIDDVVGFHGESVAELRAAFEEAVDDYLQTCEKLNRPRQKSKLYSGNLYKDPIMSDRETERTFYSNPKSFKRYCILFQLGEMEVSALSNSLDE